MDYVTQAQWQELEARVAALEEEEKRRRGEEDMAPFAPPLLPVERSPIREEKSEYTALPQRSRKRELDGETSISALWNDAPFAAKCAFLKPLLHDDSPEWFAVLEQLEALDAMCDRSSALENWLMQYPALFVDMVEKLANVREAKELEEQVAANVVSQFRNVIEARYARLAITWILPKPGSQVTSECEVVGTEASDAPVGTVARCVRRGFCRNNQLVLAAQVTRSNGQILANISPPVETPTERESIPAGQSESFAPAMGEAFDSETMEVVGARRTAHAHEDNTVARVETPGTRIGDAIVAKAQVLIYRMGAGL